MVHICTIFALVVWKGLKCERYCRDVTNISEQTDTHHVP